MAKHRESLFIVVRQSYSSQPAALCEAYSNLDAAEEAVGRMYQQCRDKGVFGYTFVVQPCTYYDS